MMIGILLIGTIADIILQDFYVRQTINYNRTVVRALREYVLKDVINGIDRTYLDVISVEDGSEFFVDLFDMEDISYKNIKKAINYMNDIAVSENGWLDGIYTYFSEAGVLAGTDGLIYKRGNRANTVPDWMNSILENEDKYIPTRHYDMLPAYGEGNQCMLVKPYPVLYGNGNVKGYLIFKVDEKTFSRILSQSDVLNGGEYRAIIDKNGNIISSTLEEHYPAVFDGAKELYKQTENSGYIETKLNSKRYIITYSSIEPYDWRLISVCPKGVFYRTLYNIHLVMLAVSIAAILMGLVIARHYKRKIYSPIKRIATRLVGIEDEDVDVDAAINHISRHVENMQDMVDSAKQSAKRELIISLCLNNGFNAAEFKKLVKIYPFNSDKKMYAAAIFKLDKDVAENLTAESINGIIVNGIDIIESMSDEDTEYMACYFGNNEILTVAGFSHSNENIIVEEMKNVKDTIFTAYYLNLISVVGIPVKRHEDIHLSYESVREAEKYVAFSKQQGPIYAPDVLKLETSSLVIDERIMEKLRRNIYLFDLPAIKDDLKAIAEEMSGGGYSASYCNSKLLEIVNMISVYIRNNGMNSDEIMDKDLISGFNEMENISEYLEWVYAILERLAQKMDIRNETDMQRITERAKAYIADNLSKELSLTSVSDYLHISSQYFCKIFKEETDMNFVDYVTLVRMEKAKELLTTTNMNIESVARSVGYNTPHYFTKKFKERFGVTPKTFRMNQ